MSYDVHVTGRKAPMRFDRFTTARAYRQAIVRTTGRCAWIQASR
jgi:hypothetical protein